MIKKKQRPHLVSIFHLNSNIAGKDMFLVPLYLSKALGASAELVYPRTGFNKEFGDEYRGVKLTPIKSNSKYHCTPWSEKEMFWWLVKNAHCIDVLSLFWLNPRNLIFAFVYKLLNPDGLCYIKGDVSSVGEKPVGLLGKMRGGIRHYLYHFVDVYSVETRDIYTKIKAGFLGEHLKRVTVLMFNGFDVEMFEKMDINRKLAMQKENLMLTVGRIGSVEKNNEMILQALDGLDIEEWKFWFVGPVEERFHKIYIDFIERNPDKKEKVILIGEINNKRELWEIYNNAKVFVLTSPKECMAQVYSEALAFGNYIITTDVQGSKEITDNGRVGRIVGVGDLCSLRCSIKEVIESKVDLDYITNMAHKLSIDTFNWSCLTNLVSERIKELWNEKFD